MTTIPDPPIQEIVESATNAYRQKLIDKLLEAEFGENYKKVRKTTREEYLASIQDLIDAKVANHKRYYERLLKRIQRRTRYKKYIREYAPDFVNYVVNGVVIAWSVNRNNVFGIMIGVTVAFVISRMIRKWEKQEITMEIEQRAKMMSYQQKQIERKKVRSSQKGVSAIKNATDSVDTH